MTPTREDSGPSRAINDTPVAATRVCLKNLPPSLTSHQLRVFLKERLAASTTVTDCRVLSKNGKSRRMAFCGFETPDMASECVRQLNRAYCRNQKLMVEFAKLRPQKDIDDRQTEEATLEAKKEKSTEQLEKEARMEKKKMEFLAVMGVTGESTTKKFWANDDGYRDSSKEDVTEAPKSKEQSTSTDPSTSDSDHDSSDSEDDDADPMKNKAKSSDLDFLRSKQVQVEDLDEIPDRGQRKGIVDSTDDDSSSESSTSIENEEQNNSSPAEALTEPPRSEIKSELSDTRLFLRNLPFSTTDDSIKELLSPFGTVLECHVPTDDQNQSKGFGFGSMGSAAQATAALTGLDGTDFQGRLLHVMRARQAPSEDVGLDDSKLTYAQRQERLRKQNAESQTGWSAAFVRGDAVVDNLASRLGLRKGDVLNVKDDLRSGDAAVRLALAETAVIEENRTYFKDHGVDMEALVSMNQANSGERSKTKVLVKNLPHDTAQEELLKMFSIGSCTPERILLPPSRTIAVVQYAHGNEAKSCFRKLAYRRFKSVPLYLEWAPLTSETAAKQSMDVTGTDETKENSDEQDEVIDDSASTIHVKNLNFSTTEDQLRSLFEQYAKDIRHVRIPKKVMSGRNGQEIRELSMGYGFVEFGSSASLRNAMTKVQGLTVDGHALELKLSVKNTSSVKAAVPSSAKNTKIIVRNVPFQANRKELLQLFGSFGQLKKVRLPKKFDGSHRGFAFCEYVTNKEASAAMQTLASTHLYGRHLVLEWASVDDDNLDELREKAKRNISEPRPNKKIRFT